MDRDEHELKGCIMFFGAEQFDTKENPKARDRE